MAQNVLDYTYDPTGNELMDDYLPKMAENCLTNNSGSRRPTYAVENTVWVDTSDDNTWRYKIYDGTSDIVLFELDNITKKITFPNISGVFRFKGSVATVSALPATGNLPGDVYNVVDGGANYAWNGSEWDKLSENLEWGRIVGTLSNQTDLQNALNAKQPTLVSGTNIKTINGSSVLGSGDLSVTAQIAWGSITGTLSNQTDLQNALNAKQDVATAVNYDNISNCITEIPQDIKLELNNGTLTLKAGSKVYVPNGSGVFDTVTIASDKTITVSSNGEKFIFLNTSENLQSWDTFLSFSGNTAPTSYHYPLWYDITNNIIKQSSDYGSTWSGKFSFPLCVVTVSNGAISNIDQVFNGFGYIGSTVFALPGVKGLIPNGRNADGTLKNIEFTNSAVMIKTFSGSGNYSFGLANNAGWIFQPFVSSEIQPSVNYTLWYKPSDNILYSTDIGTPTKTGYMYAFDISMESNRITSLTPKTAFHAVDYNDFSELKDTVDSDVVKLTGNQNIAGVKTFTTDIYASKSGNFGALRIKNTNYDYLTNPSALQYQHIVWQDKNNKEMSFVLQQVDTSGTVKLCHAASNYKTDGTRVSCEIGCYVNRAGSIWTSAPTPATADNSTKIATTAYVKNQGYIGSANLATCHVVTQTYVNGTSWYRVYDDGWIEQGGIVNYTSDSLTTVNLLKSYKNTNYCIQITIAIVGDSVCSDNLNGQRFSASNITSSSFQVRGQSSSNTNRQSWYACGMGA